MRGEDLVHWRGVRGWTQAKLAAALGVSTRAVIKWEAAKVPHKRVAAVVEALGVPDEPVPVSVASAALDGTMAGLVEEHGGREVLGSLVRVWRP